MAPIDAIDSFVGLVDFKGSKTFSMLLESVKECYEALVIAKFLALLYSYLNISIFKNTIPDEIKGREIHHSFPKTLFQPQTVRLNHHTLKLQKYWTWQFVVIRPICSILMISLQLLGLYSSWLSWTFTIILNISVSLALYSLVVFYDVFARELAPLKPLARLLCIKGIVFFCFGQLLAVFIPTVGLGAFLWWASRDMLQGSCPNCGNEFQIFKSTLNDGLQLCPFCSQPFSVVGDKFVSDPVKFSKKSTPFGQAFSDFSPGFKKGKESSSAVVDVEAEVEDAD